ncbi:MAG TPA: hypothetical protein DCE56_32690 [Cyanobacteria bacterium UBA8553]|nr:hypothetical protein [Cyanobacteria bacterium UBA8553]HAJ62314.1 hypothetical protein [Cyanobacteria bacterium UBA8543]
MINRVFLLPLSLSFLVGGYPVVQAVQAKQPVEVAQAKWEQVSSTEGGFTVLMPIKPAQKTQTTEGAALSLEDHRFIASLEEGKVTYIVSYTNFPEELSQLPPNVILDSISSRFTNDKKLKSLNQQDITLGQYSGKEFKFETPEGTLVKQRFFLVKQRLYQVITEIPKARESALSSDVEKFMSSFKLL